MMVRCRVHEPPVPPARVAETEVREAPVVSNIQSIPSCQWSTPSVWPDCQRRRRPRPSYQPSGDQQLGVVLQASDKLDHPA